MDKNHLRVVFWFVSGLHSACCSTNRQRVKNALPNFLTEHSRAGRIFQWKADPESRRFPVIVIKNRGVISMEINKKCGR